MTVILDPGNDPDSYIDAQSRQWKLTAGLWRVKDVADLATLATRTSERDTARNGLYVSGVYQSGQTWQTKDGTDLANYNAMVTDRNNWQTNANTAYDSGTWGAGTPWSSRYTTEHAAYLAIYPAGSGTSALEAGGNVANTSMAANVPTNLAINVGTNTLGVTGSGSTSITIPRLGNYVMAVRVRSFTDNRIVIQIKVNNAAVGISFANNGAGNEDPAWAFMPQQGIGAGTTIQIEATQQGGVAGNQSIADVDSTWWLYYIPTPTWPH